MEAVAVRNTAVRLAGNNKEETCDVGLKSPAAACNGRRHGRFIIEPADDRRRRREQQCWKPSSKRQFTGESRTRYGRPSRWRGIGTNTDYASVGREVVRADEDTVGMFGPESPNGA